jgi:hypothetical protein
MIGFIFQIFIKKAKIEKNQTVGSGTREKKRGNAAVACS